MAVAEGKAEKEARSGEEEGPQEADEPDTPNAGVVPAAGAGEGAEDLPNDVRMLHEAGAGRWGTDEGRFVETLCGASREYRTQLYDEYGRVYGRPLDDVIRGEIGGACGTALAHLVTPTALCLAKKLRAAMEGLGTDDGELIRIVVTQRERHLAAIMACFEDAYDRTLRDWIESECGGHYSAALCRFVLSFSLPLPVSRAAVRPCALLLASHRTRPRHAPCPSPVYPLHAVPSRRRSSVSRSSSRLSSRPKQRRGSVLVRGLSPSLGLRRR